MVNPKRVRVAAPHVLEWVEDPSLGRDPGPLEVAVQPLVVGICGSDLHVLEGLHPFVQLPVSPGHEVVAKVTALGANVDANWLDAHVAIEPNITCGTCDACRRGQYNICESLQVIGFQTPGAMAERFVVAVGRLHRLPQGFPLESGAMIEPSAVAVHAVLKTNVVAKTVAVIGAGTIGLLVAQVARAFGAARVVVADLNPGRLEVAKQLGLETSTALHEKFDVVFECVGLGATLTSAIEHCRKGGDVVVVGVYGQPATIPAALIQDWELRLVGCLMYTFDDYRQAILLLEQQRLVVAPLITHRFKLHQAKHAFETALERDTSLKVLLLGEGI